MDAVYTGLEPERDEQMNMGSMSWQCLRNGTATPAVVVHDDDCGIFRGRGSHALAHLCQQRQRVNFGGFDDTGARGAERPKVTLILETSKSSPLTQLGLAEALSGFPVGDFQKKKWRRQQRLPLRLEWVSPTSLDEPEFTPKV